MRHVLDQDQLTIYLEGELNSFNSEEVEQEIEKITSEGNFKSIVLDLDQLNYISSAGLRIVVRLKQKYDDTSLINVPKEVYDIFEMVGFQNLISIKRK